MAEVYANNEKPTKLIIFETNTSPLIKTGSFKNMGGGYYYYELDLSDIGKFPKDKAKAPTPSAELFKVWAGARRSRALGQREANLRITTEGKNRMGMRVTKK